MHLEFVTDYALSTALIKLDYLLPFQIRNVIGDWLPLDFSINLQAQQTGHALIAVKDSPVFIHHQHAVLNGVEERFKKAALPYQPLHHGLQPLGIEPVDATKNLV